MTDQLSGAPPYTVAGVKFECWITDRTNMPGTSRYEWRDATKRLMAGKNLGRGDCWASCDGKPVKGYHPTLGSAMAAAIVAASSLKRAA